MSETDKIEWTWTILHLAGMGLLAWVLKLLYVYRKASRIPGHNARRGIFVKILLRFGWVSFILHTLLAIAGIAALFRENLTESATIAGLVVVVVALLLDLAWILTIRDFLEIQMYSQRKEDKKLL